jgi:hypothetical protein
VDENRSPEVFRGHLDECLKHLDSQLAGIALCHRESARKPIADFCGVTTDTVRRWQQGTQPSGETLIKLMSYLDAVGYRIIELERMSKPRRNFAELIGFGLISSNDAALSLGYVRPSNLHPILLSHKGTSRDKDQKMWDIWKTRREELNLRKEKATRQNHLDMIKVIYPKKVEDEPAMTTFRQPAVVSIMEGLLGLLEEKTILDQLTDLKASADIVDRLSASLSVLSSRLIKPQQQKGGDE